MVDQVFYDMLKGIGDDVGELKTSQQLSAQEMRLLKKELSGSFDRIERERKEDTITRAAHEKDQSEQIQKLATDLAIARTEVASLKVKGGAVGASAGGAVGLITSLVLKMFS